MSANRVLATMLVGLALCGATTSGAQGTSDENLSINARFLQAARQAEAAGIDRGLRDGAAVNARNRLGETALVIVLKKNRSDLALRLIDAGADVNLAALNGVTPLMSAAFNGDVAVAQRLLAKGADPAAIDRLRKTAMVYAAGEGQTDVVRLLLAQGVAVNALYDNELTALMWAAGFGKTATVKALLAAGARTDLKDNRGKTAADIARDGNFDDTVSLIDSATPRAEVRR